MKVAHTEHIDPTTVLWYQHPAEKWGNALPVGNGRLGAMIFGGVDEERIQFNEDTYWSGGPYSQTREGGAQVLPAIQKLVFEGECRKAHKLFGRYLMGYPVEQMKYQSMGNLILESHTTGESHDYTHRLNLDEAITTVTYVQNGVRFTREVFATPIDQVLVVRLTTDTPGSLSFSANLRGCRNPAHSNYATDYFQMDGYGEDGLTLRGKSADYLGVQGKMRYQARLKAIPEGGSMHVQDTELIVRDADAVTLYLAAATNFVNYRDVSADPNLRVEETLNLLYGRSFEDIRESHLQEHRRLFRRVTIDLGAGQNSHLPTDERLAKFDGTNDPNLAALCLQFGRYLLITSSRPGSQPANLQGIWNEDMNPSWDSKYTTNINTQMNYWPAEVGNLSECTQPLTQMIQELTDQGSDVAQKHYGAGGWVFHQNTDIWRVAAPMDGPAWGTFATGGAWLCTHLWEHYLYTGDEDYLREVYPVMKGCVQFFLDSLVEHPTHRWLVTNPSSSPENFPVRPGDDRFFDEVVGFSMPGATICAGSTIDMQILQDLFGYCIQAATILDVDQDFKEIAADTRIRLAPMQVGKEGDLQEWLEDWGQREKSHRHISHMYGLYPGNQISVQETPELARACEVVLEQRGLGGTGWASAWKMACWARLHQPEKAMQHFVHYVQNYCYHSLFAICAQVMQVDGSLGVSAAVAEMLLQSHEGVLHMLPTLPASWSSGRLAGLCARGGFEIAMAWQDGRLISAEILSKLGGPCRLRVAHPITVSYQGEPIETRTCKHGSLAFHTEAGQVYELIGVPTDG